MAILCREGHRRRVLDHFSSQQRSRRARIINSLKRRDLSPSIDILTHGLADESTAYRIESAVIDTLSRNGLANKVRGKQSRVYGRMTLRQVIGKYANRVQISHPSVQAQALYNLGAPDRLCLRVILTLCLNTRIC
jgi:hypothetical protein